MPGQKYIPNPSARMCLCGGGRVDSREQQRGCCCCEACRDASRHCSSRSCGGCVVVVGWTAAKRVLGRGMRDASRCCGSRSCGGCVRTEMLQAVAPATMQDNGLLGEEFWIWWAVAAAALVSTLTGCNTVVKATHPVNRAPHHHAAELPGLQQLLPHIHLALALGLRRAVGEHTAAGTARHRCQVWLVCTAQPGCRLATYRRGLGSPSKPSLMVPPPLSSTTTCGWCPPYCIGPL